MHLERPLYAIDIRQIGPVSYVAYVVLVLESGRDGAVVHTTRIYDDPEYVARLAQQWIADNERNVP
jgi:hypothetical protein